MKRGERGFTLVELLVALTIVTMVASAAGPGIFQIVKNNRISGNHVTAVMAVQNADHAISEDVKRAQSVITENLTAPDFLKLSWVDVNEGDEYQVTYSLADMSDGQEKELRRTQTINGGPATTIMVSSNINPDADKTSCNITGGVFSMTITSTVGAGVTEVNETWNIEVMPRPG